MYSHHSYSTLCCLYTDLGGRNKTVFSDDIIIFVEKSQRFLKISNSLKNSFSVYHIKRFMMSLCLIAGDVYLITLLSDVCKVFPLQSYYVSLWYTVDKYLGKILWYLWKSWFFSNIHLLILASISGSFLQHLLLWSFPNGDVWFLSFFLYVLIEILL